MTAAPFVLMWSMLPDWSPNKGMPTIGTPW
uniref:Uncharacterized protein n=1 Tax=Anguilla anguilla TaxID=7936 RepID=A0A0E9VD58_ANGAN